MNAFHIKLVAVAGMIVSHAGIFFFPQHPILRIIGTIAFPLFAWLIANGVRHTRDENAYAWRLFAFAALSQIPFALANGMIDDPLGYLNVFFTLYLGLLAIIGMRRWPGRMAQFGIVAGCVIAAQWLNTDYGAAGVLSIVAFHVFFDRFWLMAASQVVILGALPYLALYIAMYHDPAITRYYVYYQFQWVSLASLAVIALYDGQRGYPLKYAFYAFYPLHFIGIYLVHAFTRV